MTDKMYWNLRPSPRPSWMEPRRGQKRKAQPLPDLEEVMSAVLGVSGSAPIHGGLSLSKDVLVNSSVAVSVSVEDMVQASVPT